MNLALSHRRPNEMRKRFVSLTNIPTPYRIHFYRELNVELAQRNIALEVMFMAWSERGRHWKFQPETWGFDYTVGVDLHPHLRSQVFHLNPGLIARLLSHPPRWLLISGGWFHPTVQATIWLSNVNKTQLLFWSESNANSLERDTGFFSRWRHETFRRFKGFVTPGVMANEYVERFSSEIPAKPIIHLPNVVDEAKFRDGVKVRRAHKIDVVRESWGILTSNKRVLVTVARLEPSKGIFELVDALRTYAGVNEVLLLIAGAGSLQAQLETLIQESQLEKSVRLLGYLNEESVLDVLSLADAFVLPSLGDPYPLGVIEAAFAGLPLLLSDRVGCHPEILTPQQNGFLFNTQDASSIHTALDAFLSLTPELRSRMGEQSLAIAEERFGTHLSISRFVDTIAAL